MMDYRPGPMSLTSTFYVGAAAEIARAIQKTPLAAAETFPSMGGLQFGEVELACGTLRALRGVSDPSLSIDAGDVLSGTAEGGQVIRMAPGFVSAFAELTDAEAGEISRVLVESDQKDMREFEDRMRRNASRPIQSPLDYAALVMIPVFAWIKSGSISITLAIAAAWLTFALVVLPWWRRRRSPALRASAPPDEYRPGLLRLAKLCRRAMRERQDVVYEWSL